MSSSFESDQPGKDTIVERDEIKSDTVIPEMLLFDIDGVITEPVTGKVEVEVVNEIIAILERGEPVAFNTGRGLQWVMRDIFPYFKARVSTREVFNKLCIVYQKGAFRLSFNNEGELEKPVAAPGILLPPSTLRAEVLQLISTTYAETMFPGEEKDAVLSPQYKPDSKYKQYQADQAHLVNDLQALLQRYNLSDQYRIDPTRIATDVEDKQLGKALGSQQILIWLHSQGLQPERFITFGDSLSDIGMAEEIYRHGLPVEFVFVGGKEQLQGMQLPFPTTITDAFCEKGTVEYLKNRPHKRMP